MRKIKHPWIAQKTSPFSKINTETASYELNQTAPDLHAELYFTRFMETSEAEFRWIIRETDGKDASRYQAANLGRDPVHESRTAEMYTWGLSLSSIPSTNAVYKQGLSRRS